MTDQILQEIADRARQVLFRRAMEDRLIGYLDAAADEITGPILSELQKAREENARLKSFAKAVIDASNGVAEVSGEDDAETLDLLSDRARQALSPAPVGEEGS